MCKSVRSPAAAQLPAPLPDAMMLLVCRSARCEGFEIDLRLIAGSLHCRCSCQTEGRAVEI